MAAVTAIPASFEREIECSICHDPFEDPRCLSCLHTFCFECVQRLAKGNRVVLCPLCRKKTALPSNGAMGLTKNNLAHMMVEFVTRTESHDKGIIMCQSEHEIRRRAEFFCQSCKSIICGSCGMTRHRDPTQHQTFPIDQKLTKMQEDLQDLLEWGRNEEREQVERKELLELKQQEVTNRFTAIEAAIDHTFAEERKLREDRETNLKQNLWDMKRAIKTAIQKLHVCNAEEEAAPISDLNCLTEDILAGGAGAVMEMHQEIFDGYRSQKEGVAQVDAVGSLQQLSEFISAIRFEQESIEEIPVVGRIVSNTGYWMLEQVRFAGNLYCNPSSFIELSNGFIAVGFGTESDIELFDRSCQRYRPVGPMAVKDMAPLSDDYFLVLDQDGDIFRLSASQNHSICLLKQGMGPLEDDRPSLIAADVGNKFALLYDDRVQSYSKDGVLELIIRLQLGLGVEPRRMQFLRDSGGSKEINGRRLEILMGSGKAVRALRFELLESPRLFVSDICLLDEALGRNVGHTVDTEGNLFIAFIQNDAFVTIKKYRGGDQTKGEGVIADLQVEMEDEGTILLSSLGPSCFAMCTSKKLSVFKKGTVDDFLNGIGLA